MSAITNNYVQNATKQQISVVVNKGFILAEVFPLVMAASAAALRHH